MDWLAKMGCENVMELDWWEENCVPGQDNITFVCTPSQHWSKRTAWDDNKVPDKKCYHVYCYQIICAVYKNKTECSEIVESAAR